MACIESTFLSVWVLLGEITASISQSFRKSRQVLKTVYTCFLSLYSLESRNELDVYQRSLLEKMLSIDLQRPLIACTTHSLWIGSLLFKSGAMSLIISPLYDGVFDHDSFIICRPRLCKLSSHTVIFTTGF